MTTWTLVSNAGDDPTPSRFTNVISAERTYHVLKIDGYSGTVKAAGCGRALRSFPFRAGGCTWYISYYPNGSGETNTDYISFFIHLDDTVDKNVAAHVTFSLLDRQGDPVRSHTLTTTLLKFSMASTSGLGYRNFIRRDDLERSEYLNGDCFAIAVHLIITEEPPFVEVPPSDMHLHYGDLLSSKEGTDVEFVVGGETFAAHRLVLAARSPVFKAKLFMSMNEGATTNIIHIDDMDAQVFKALLAFIYTDTLPEIGQEEDEMAMAQRLLIAAIKYGLSRLKLVCEDRLCNHIDTGSVATILVFAEKYHCHGLKEVCFNFLGSSRALSAAMKADNFRHLTESCPTILADLISNIVVHQLQVKLSV